MLIGVVSDTHNNFKNIDQIIAIFNSENLGLVIHTGDITKAETLRKFSNLNCPLMGVFGNNDRLEQGLEEVCNQYNFVFRDPPLSLLLGEKKFVVFHEPDEIESYVNKHRDIDVVLHGHTHRHKEETKDDIIYFNPGECAGFVQGKNAIGVIDTDGLDIRRIFF
jgi:putative phosphoesterase